MICAFWSCPLCLFRSFYPSNWLNPLFIVPFCSLESDTSKIIGDLANLVMVQFLFRKKLRQNCLQGFVVNTVCAELQASQSTGGIFKICYLAFLRVWHFFSLCSHCQKFISHQLQIRRATVSQAWIRASMRIIYINKVIYGRYLVFYSL